MADTCQNISKALNNLSQKIDAQNKCCNEVRQKLNSLSNRVGNLERDIKGLKQGQKNPQSLAEILKRISALESYCLSVEQMFTDVEKASSGIMKQVLGFMDFFSFIFK